ncbi:beta-porphyranase A-like [Haliotis asinina]|uniref:beta-porphyranase A-like n=1 Tax=Haliotis asinina TaxID=109174 RepID=UPI003531C7EF
MLLQLLATLLVWGSAFSDTTVTIYNEWLSQGGRVHYEVERWNKINGLTHLNLIPKCKAIGTAAGRWVNRDIQLFTNWPQSPSHHGYPDPTYLQDHALQSKSFTYYMQQLANYGNNISDMVWNIQGRSWPDWIDKSHHHGGFPNNIDAASEFVSLMVQSAKDYTGGRLPHIFEVINEPDWYEDVIDPQTNIDFHRAVADKLKSRFGMKVAGPSYTSMALRQADENNFSFWKKTAKFLDMSLDHLDFFSFHSYNYLLISGGNHTYSGINEARLVASLDMVENYSHIKKGKNVQLVNTEFGLGLGNLKSFGPNFENGMLDFETIYQENGFMFTFLNLREFIDRVTVFLLSNEQFPGHTALRKSLFTRDGHPLQNTKFFTFWKNFVSDQRFLRVSSQYDGQERIVSPLALANPRTKEMVVLLHNYGSKWQNVKLDFPNNWLNPTTGEETCVLFENDNPSIHANYHFDRSKLHGTVGLPGSSTCFYKFKTNYNFGGIRTDNENTYYGKKMIIPISNGHAQTTISLPSSGYHLSYLRLGISRDKNADAKPKTIVFNGHTLSSSYMLFDAMKVDGKTKWNVWVFKVPPGQINTSNTVSMTFDGNGGHVTSVALVVGKIH